jgi:hypothetical protein
MSTIAGLPFTTMPLVEKQKLRRWNFLPGTGRE